MRLDLGGIRMKRKLTLGAATFFRPLEGAWMDFLTEAGSF
jgi:hypothetical protein